MIKKNILWIVIGGLLLITGFNGCSSYNGLVDSEVEVDKSWADVESQYQRRYDLIGNLVNTVKGAADFEKSTLTEITNARAKVGSMTMTAEALKDPVAMQNFMQAQSQMSGALSRLLVVAEQYPNLKSNQNFLELQAQLEGTENRIQTARVDYNAAVGLYNKKVKRFPGKLWASIFGFDPREMFNSEEAAAKPREVEFNF